MDKPLAIVLLKFEPRSVAFAITTDITERQPVNFLAFYAAKSSLEGVF